MSSKDDEKQGVGLYTIAPEKLSHNTVILTESISSRNFKTVEDNDPDIMCGYGSWTPKWLQWAANPKLFLFLYSMAGLTQGAGFTYFVGCISTMEKRYAYDTKRSGMIIISEEIPPILFGAIIAYFGGLAHRPKLVTFGMLTGALSSFTMALPYFIYGRIDESLQRPASGISGVNSQFCDKDFNVLSESCNNASISTIVHSIFVIGNFLKGVAGTIFYTIGTSYVDDSIKKKNSPLYLGILFALRLLGPTLGFLLSSLCLQFYEDPFSVDGI